MTELMDKTDGYATPETQIALWWRRPIGFASAGRMSGVVQSALNASDGRAWLTEYFWKKQRERHPEFEAEDYARLPGLLREYRVAVKEGNHDVIVVGDAGNILVIVLRKDRAGKVLVRSMSRVRDKKLSRLMTLPVIDGDWEWLEKLRALPKRPHCLRDGLRHPVNGTCRPRVRP